ncbi:preprotein translocase subunit SecE, partial [Enterobacter hormaechei]|nr:preprotein translocase subunit SecE [Enterobacter hormaechei]
MTPKTEAQESRFDLFKWLAVVALVVVGVVGNQYYSASPILYRVLVLLALAAVAGFVALQTAKGKSFFALAKEARTEIRKVVWPTRQE